MLTNLLDQISPEQYPVIWVLLTFVLGFSFCLFSIPSILFVSRDKRLMADPEERSSHHLSTPTLGGVAIYISIMLVLTFIGAFLDTRTLLIIMGAITILFFFGLKDDLANISSGAKVLGQLAAIMLIIVFTDTRILSFSGVFGIETLPYGFSIAFTVFVFLLLINAINLIDGIDGLAGSVGAVCCLVLGIFFFKQGNTSLATLAAALLGALIGFLRYNFSVSKKIFMGDTGSLVIGYVLAFLSVSFVNFEQSTISDSDMHITPIFTFAIVFYPIADTTRIFFLRIFKYKRNPFIADRNHIHHHYTNLGFSHKKSTFYIVGINIFIISLAYLLKDLAINIQLIALLFYGPLLFTSTFAVRKAKEYNNLKRDNRIKKKENR